MNWLLHTAGQTDTAIDKPLMRIGSAPGAEIYLPQPGLAPVHAVLHAGTEGVWLETAGHPVHVNGRPIHSVALLRAGDDLHFGSLPARLLSASVPATAPSGGSPVAFAGRVVLRQLTGRDAGRAHVLLNSLCIGRSVLSEIRIDDMALAERQVLLQRQGGGIIAKNLSPVLEMRVNGWACTEAQLAMGAQICLDQHRFVLEMPCPDLTEADAPVSEATADDESAPVTTAPAGLAPFFSITQWLLLGAAIAVSAAIVLLLTLSP